MTRRYAAIVPLRGGSKSIPRKNILSFAGKPLCAWVLEAALAASEIGEVWVSTDDEQIAEVVAQTTPPVRIHFRPAALGGDLVKTEAVIQEWILTARIEASHIVLLQATSPQTTAADISAAVARFAISGADSLVTGTRSHRFLWHDDGQPLNYDPAKRPMRQEWPGTFMENGAFYISSRDYLAAGGARLHGRVELFEMNEFYAIEIDDADDWLRLEHLFRKRMAS
jgi:CMP-N-acetylneuraminic acid synthetase